MDRYGGACTDVREGTTMAAVVGGTLEGTVQGMAPAGGSGVGPYARGHDVGPAARGIGVVSTVGPMAGGHGAGIPVGGPMHGARQSSAQGGDFTVVPRHGRAAHKVFM